MIYQLLKLIVGLGIRLYYRQVRVKNREYLDTRGPMIIIANHPNTLMDAWMIGHICNQRIYYMAKGTFFNSRWKRWVLGGLGMIPVNRQVDGAVAEISNEDSFEACYRLLEEGKTLVIFPEGSSFQERLLRKLKSGTARIALQTELRNDSKLGLKIVPVGLIYMQPEKFRSSVLATVGTPIDPTPWVEEFRTDSLKSARKLTEEFRKGLSRLLVNSEMKEEEELAENISHLLSSNYSKSSEKGVERDVATLRRVFEQLNTIRVVQPWKIKEVQLLVDSLKIRVEYLDVKSDFLDRKYRSMMFVRQLVTSFLVLLICLPGFLYGMIHNYIQYRLVDTLVLRLVKEVEYFAPVSILFSLVIYPVSYALWTIGFKLFILDDNWWALAYFCSLPLSGLFAFSYAQYFRHVSLKRKFVFLMRKRKTDMETLKQERESLRKLLFEH